MGVVFVHQRDVEVQIFLILEHAAQTVRNDDRDLVGEGRIVGDAVGNGGCEQMAMAVLVLKPLPVERGPSGGAAQKEAAAAHVARRPGKIADALQSKH